MNKINVIFCLVSLFLLSIACQNTESESVEPAKPYDGPVGTFRDLMESIANEHFTTDYPLKIQPELNGVPPSHVLSKYGSLPYIDDWETFKSTYQKEKKELFTKPPSELDKQYMGGFQGISLRLLRLKFLKAPTSTFTINEVKQHLNKLVDFEAIDLDVMVDAYIYVQNDLSAEEKNKIIQYLRKVYNADETLIASQESLDKKLEKLKAQETSKDQYLEAMSLKNWERIIHTLEYCKKVLPEIATSID